MITVSSCGVKLLVVLSGLEKERLKHWKYTCTFVAFLNITIITLFFLSTCGVINPCVTVYGFPSYADNSKYVAAFSVIF